MTNKSFRKYLGKILGITVASRSFLYSFVFLMTFRITFYLANWNNKKGQVLPDSTEYIKLSTNFSDAYFGNTDDLLELSIRRPPGYPFLLHLLGSNTFLMGLIQHLMVIAIAILTIRMLNIMLGDEQISKTSSIMVLLEPSLFVESSVVLSEISFVFFASFALYFTVKSDKRKFDLISSLFAGLSFALAIFCRPIGVIIIVVLLIAVVAQLPKLNWNHFLILFTIIIFYVSWTIRNYSLASTFEFSTQQSHNVHLWEGSGAVAFAQDVPIDKVHESEAKLMEREVGKTPSISQEASYRTDRGITLIRENVFYFILMHIVGVFKILFGPGQGEFVFFISNGQQSSATNLWQRLLVAIFASITISIVILSSYGVVTIFRKAQAHTFLVPILFVALNLIFSSGFQAYSRFRVPIAPLICIFASIGLVHLLRGHKLIKKRAY